MINRPAPSLITESGVKEPFNNMETTMSDVLTWRKWLERGAWLTAGAVVGVSGVRWWEGTPLVAQEAATGAEARLKELGLELPANSAPTNTFVPTVQVGELLFVAGHGPKTAEGKPIVGKVGDNFTLEEGQQAARRVGLQLLSVVRESLGSLDRVVRVVKTLGMVNCTPDFTQQPRVINGCSDLMVEVFGEINGKGARSAVGMSSLPGGIPVEIEMVFQVRK